MCGGALDVRNNLPIVAFYTVYKASSIFLLFVRRMAERSGYVGADFMGYAFSGGKCGGELFGSGAWATKIFRKRRFFISFSAISMEESPVVRRTSPFVSQEPAGCPCLQFLPAGVELPCFFRGKLGQSCNDLPPRRRDLTQSVDTHVIENAFRMFGVSTKTIPTRFFPLPRPEFPVSSRQ